MSWLRRSAFNESLRLNSNNARAVIGLGGVQTVRAQRLLNEGKSPSFDGDPQTMLAAAQTEALRALETYGPVAAGAEQTEVYGVPVSSIAKLGQGIALRVLGDAAYREGDPAAAQQAITRAIETLESAVTPLEESTDYRLMAQLAQALGSVYEWQAFLLKSRRPIRRQRPPMARHWPITRSAATWGTSFRLMST